MTRQEETQILRTQVMLKTISSYYEFVKLFFNEATGAKLVDNWHIKYICDKLQKIGMSIVDEEIPNYPISLFNLPPGSSKSTLITVLFPVWLWLHKPSLEVITSSYASDLSVTLSGKSRKVINSDLFTNMYNDYFKKKFGKRFRLVKETDGRLENNMGGIRHTTSTNGSVTGMHGRLIIVDDNLNAEQAHSKAEINKSNRFFSESLSSRTNDKERTKTIIVMQRLAENDLTGYLLTNSKELVDLTVLPAEISDHITPDYLRENYVNGLMDNLRMPIKALNEFKIRLGSLAYGSQFLQNPLSGEGGILKRAWFIKIKSSDIPINLIWNAYIDGAYTKNENNDPTGIMLCSYYKGDLIIKLFTARHLEMPELISYIKGLRERGDLTNESRIYIEPKASGHSLQQLLNKERFNAINIHSKLVQESKNARANLISPYAEAGHIKLIESPWNEDFIVQLTGFPNAKHDEAIDCLGYGVDGDLKNGNIGITVGPGKEKPRELTPDEIADREWNRRRNEIQGIRKIKWR